MVRLAFGRWDWYIDGYIFPTKMSPFEGGWKDKFLFPIDGRCVSFLEGPTCRPLCVSCMILSGRMPEQSKAKMSWSGFGAFEINSRNWTKTDINSMLLLADLVSCFCDFDVFFHPERYLWMRIYLCNLEVSIGYIIQYWINSWRDTHKFIYPNKWI